jgi:hypothetical protein
LNATNRVILDGNKFNDYGGAQFPGAIAVGLANDSQDINTIGIEIRNNRITNGPTGPNGIYNFCVQLFHPGLVEKNFCHTVNGTAWHNKTRNSLMRCNEAVNIIGDGALYNRLDSGNVWEYNIVRDSNVGIDHFMGHNTIYRGNIIYNVNYAGRIKNQGIGSSTVRFENNTFYNTRGHSGFIWDLSSSAALSNILWTKNIWHTVTGAAISMQTEAAWDETENVFRLTQRPTGTTGAGGTSSAIDPRFVNPPADFTVQEPQAAGKGAPWPLPCQ